MIVVHFELEDKQTTNNVRFKELPEFGQAPKFGTIYQKRWAWEADGSPTHYKVTFEEE